MQSSAVRIELTADANALGRQTCQSTRYTVHVRALHALNLPRIATSICPTVSVSVNMSERKTATAAQQANNHSIWNRHSLSFKLDAVEWYCVHVSVLRARGENDELVELGNLGELRLPVRPTAYEVAQFFPLYRRARAASAGARPSESALLIPAGKIKLWIRFEVEREETAKHSAAAFGRSVAGLHGGFLESLQIQRKKLKATIVPADNSRVDASKARSVMHAEEELFASEIAQIPAEHKIDPQSVQLVRQDILGQGVHSRVHRALLMPATGGHHLQVAVKEFQYLSETVPPRKVLDAFLLEYRILANLPKGAINVVGLIGVLVRPKLAIVMELCSNGSISEWMSDSKDWDSLPLVQKSAFALQLAEGIAFLHRLHIIHRDIKPHNILLTAGENDHSKQLIVKVGDLGSAVTHEPGEAPLVDEAGSTGYTAPEVFSRRGYTHKIDVWSFALVLWEMLVSGSPRPPNPFAGKTDEEIIERAREGVRPDTSLLAQSPFKSVIEACWAFDPELRPAMSEVVVVLTRIHLHICAAYTNS